MPKVTAERYHDICCGHRVHGQGGKCEHLHGHNYRVHFVVEADKGVDGVGRVLDFSAIKSLLCSWLEASWDHKFLAWRLDPIMKGIHDGISEEAGLEVAMTLTNSIVWVPFNPTAENMAAYLVNVIGPLMLVGSGCRLISVRIEETAKCSATYSL